MKDRHRIRVIAGRVSATLHGQARAIRGLASVLPASVRADLAEQVKAITGIR